MFPRLISLWLKQAYLFFFFPYAYTLHAMNIAALSAFAGEKPKKGKLQIKHQG